MYRRRRDQFCHLFIDPSVQLINVDFGCQALVGAQSLCFIKIDMLNFLLRRIGIPVDQDAYT